MKEGKNGGECRTREYAGSRKRSAQARIEDPGGGVIWGWGRNYEQRKLLRGDGCRGGSEEAFINNGAFSALSVVGHAASE